MKVPNLEQAVIDPEKLHGYILSASHPVGQFKATFFERLGYTAEDWQFLAQDLRQQLLSLDVVRTEESRYGHKYIVEGPLHGPTGAIRQVVAVWVILSGEEVPRFVTAYPGGRR